MMDLSPKGLKSKYGASGAVRRHFIIAFRKENPPLAHGGKQEGEAVRRIITKRLKGD